VFWEQLAGSGDRFDSWWAVAGIVPNGALYDMVYGGLTMMKDAP